MKLSVCIGCGCDDEHACVAGVFDDACSWLIVDRKTGLGVCSQCPEELARWKKRDRGLSLKALLRSGMRIVGEFRELIHGSEVDPKGRIKSRQVRAEIRRIDDWLADVQARFDE